MAEAAAASIQCKVQHVRHALMKQIIESAGASGGDVFGGAPRDLMIHDAAAKVFIGEGMSYNDPTVNPENTDRFHLPNDIDVFFLDPGNVEKFFAELAKRHLYSREQKKGPTYVMDGAPESIKHTKLHVAFHVPSVIRSLLDEGMYVSVDVLTREELSDAAVIPPFGGILDFVANGLMFSPNVALMPCLCRQRMSALEKFDRIAEIQQDVLQRKTQLINPNVPEHRIVKMLKMGWTLEGHAFALLVDKKRDYNDVCFVCLGEFVPSQRHVKLMCCKAHIHTHCAREFIVHNEDARECPRCKTSSICNWGASVKDARLISCDSKI